MAEKDIEIVPLNTESVIQLQFDRTGVDVAHMQGASVSEVDRPAPFVPAPESVQNALLERRMSQEALVPLAPAPENAGELTLYFRDRKVYREAEHGSFIDPSQPAPHPVYYYEKTFHATPARPALSSTASKLDMAAQANVALDLVGTNEPGPFHRGEARGSEEPKEKHKEPNACQRKCSCCVPDPNRKRKKFGMWDGVVTSCLLNIFGVIMFLRVPYIVGQAGIWQTVIIILLASFITTITTMSMSAVATNGKMKGGGAYFLISRSLGAQFGGVIGVLFGCGQAVAVALYLIGFAETLTDILGSAVLTGNMLWDVRLWAIIALAGLLVMALIGVGWVIKVQVVMLFGLMFIILSVLIGSGLPPDQVPGVTNGTAFVGFSLEVLQNNTNSAYTNGESFFSMFALFFPAVTGIMAGANLSGDLRDPGQAIPKGTFIAIGFSAIVYIMLAVFTGATVMRTQLDGEGGLYFDPLIMYDMSFWGPLVIIGIFTATLSSALASLVGAPRVAQAFCKDRIFVGSCIEPIERVFAKGRKRTNDPVAGYFLTFVIGFACCLIGSLNTIAPIITMFFMITYALINLACFAGSVTRAPGWRPSFKLYNPWLSLLGAVLCVVAMFLIEWWAGLAAIAVGVALYILLALRPPPVSWGPTGHAYQISSTVNKAIDLRKIPFHAKTWRPHIQILVGDVDRELSLLQFAHNFSRGGGMLIGMRVIVGDFRTELPAYSVECRGGYMTLDTTEARKRGQPKSRQVTMFWDVVIAESLRKGVQQHFFSSGVGKLRPNSVLIGFPEQWRSYSDARAEEYMDIIRDGFEIGRNSMVVRGFERLNYLELPSRTIDVWWLVDDGGFTILMPWLLTQRAFWANSKMRIFGVPGNVELDQVGPMVEAFKKLVTEFRIPATVHVEVPDLLSEEDYAEVIATMGVDVPDDAVERTRRYILLAQMLQEHSSDADLIFCTLPFPPDEVRAQNWLSWLDIMSRPPMPPTVFLRGNQESLLSVYT